MKLDNITLFCLTSVNFNGHIQSLLKCMDDIEFGAVKFISHEPPDNLPPNIIWENTKRVLDHTSYSEYCIFSLYKHIQTDYCLLIQHDSWILHPEMWKNEFLEYDYIGAPWPYSPQDFTDINGVIQRVGNGGFSLRSKKLLEVPLKTKILWDRHQPNEDGTICIKNRHIYEKYGCKFAPFKIAIQFSQELPLEEAIGIKPFGFHRHLPRYM